MLRTILLLVLLGGLGSAFAEPVEAPAPGLARFMRIDSIGGLTQDSVLSLAQDERGYLWLGTQDGLNRFDGRGLTAFRADGAPGQIGGNWISALLHDSRGWLWAGTSAGLFRHDYRSERFERIALGHQASGFVYDLVAGRAGEVWVGSEHGLLQWQPEPAEARLWPSAQEALPAALPDRRVLAVALAGDGTLWIGTTAGVRRFDPQSGRFAEAPGALAELQEPINDLHWDRQGRLWIAGDQSGVWMADPDSGSLTAFAALQDLRVYVILESADGRLWFGHETGLLALAAETDPGAAEAGEHYRHRPYDPHSLGRGRVRALLDAGDDGLWIGTWDGGVSGLHPGRSRLLSFTPESLGMEALREPSVLSLLPERRRLWLGTSRGVYRFDPASLEAQVVAGTETLSAWALVRDGDGLLIGSQEGLYRLDSESGRRERALGWHQLDAATIRRLTVDQGRLWLHAVPLGVHVFEDREQPPVAVHPFAGMVNQIHVLTEDRVLVLASDGLYWFSRDGRSLQHVTAVGWDEDSRQLAGRPSGLLKGPDGRIWLTLYGIGLAEMLWKPGQPPGEARFPLRLSAPRLANAGLNSLLADARGRLWLTTDRGISLYDPASDELTHFDRQDGALTRGYYFSSAAAVAEDLFAFGSKDGFTLFDPLRPPSARAPRAPRLNLVERDGRVLAPDHGQAGPDRLPVAPAHLEDWTLAPGQGRSLLFGFSSPELVLPGRLRYRYRLDGFDEDWSEAGAERSFASYGNLPPGAFTLRIKALARDGRESEETRIRLQVEPHLWQTWWARLTAGALLLLAGVAVYRLRIRHLEAIRRRLEDTVRERTRQADQARLSAEQALEHLTATQQELLRAEKLSALGQLVSGVAHEVNTPLGVALTAASHISGAVRQMRDRMREGRLVRREFEQFMDAAEEGGQLVQRNLERAAELVASFKQVSVDRSSDGRRSFEMASFISDLTASLRLLWRHRPVTLQVDCAGGLVLDSFPGALGQALTNLVQNALLHGFDEAGGEMRLQVSALDAQRLRLVFADNGRGMDEADLRRAFEPFFTTRRGSGGTGLGLHIVHNLICDKLGGSVRIESAPGKGTRFEIDLPMVAPAAG